MTYKAIPFKFYVKSATSALPIEGAAFMLYDICGNQLESVISEVDGSALLWLDRFKHYFIKQFSAPDGYEIDRFAHQVRIDRAGHIYLSANQTSLTIVNAKTTVNLTYRLLNEYGKTAFERIIKIAHGSDVVLGGNVFGLEPSFIVESFNTDPEGNGTSYVPKQVITSLKNDLTLYAR
jgi:uncharacterized surface anchored protein